MAVNRTLMPTPKASPSGPDFARMGRPASGGDDLATAVALNRPIREGLGVERDGADWVVIPPAPSLAQLLGRYGAGPGADQWAVEPDVGRMAHGVARRGDRLWTLGNGVVPQVGEVMGTLIREAMA